jgi:AraC-like DNA-binding protein
LTSQRLTRLTKRLLGLTPSQFITKSRIAAASRMLRESDQSVSEFAHACGFYDHSAFTRAFRSATGTTPPSFARNDNSSGLPFWLFDDRRAENEGHERRRSRMAGIPEVEPHRVVSCDCRIPRELLRRGLVRA